MSKYYNKYFLEINRILAEVLEAEAQNIEQASEMIADAIERKNSIFIFGASHAGIISEEMFYRAGGLALINPIFDNDVMLNVRPITKTSEMERLDGYGEIIAKNANIKEGDIVICHSVSGRNSVTNELAMTAKGLGASVIALTNLTYSKQVTSRHKSGKNLYQIADLVLDNHGQKGDACIQIEGMEQNVSPTSTVIGATIMNSIVCEVAGILVQKGITPPFFYSANVDGGDEHNKEIFKVYKDNIFYM